MKHPAIIFLLIVLLGGLTQPYLPWWTVALIPAIVVALSVDKPVTAFALGALGIGGLWLLAALWMHLPSDGVLAGRVAGTLGVGSSFWVYAITFIAGAVPGGLCGLVGCYFRKACLIKSTGPQPSR